MRDFRFVGAGSIAAVLYDLGPYPGAVRKRGRRVFGELYEIPDAVAAGAIRALDQYEGSEYERQRVRVTLTDARRRVAWAYILRGSPPKSARQVESGRFARKHAVA